jgi:hypothetical protein
MAYERFFRNTSLKYHRRGLKWDFRAEPTLDVLGGRTTVCQRCMYKSILHTCFYILFQRKASRPAPKLQDSVYPRLSLQCSFRYHVRLQRGRFKTNLIRTAKTERLSKLTPPEARQSSKGSRILFGTGQSHRQHRSRLILMARDHGNAMLQKAGWQMTHGYW